jgi:hypothetical protein
VIEMEVRGDVRVLHMNDGENRFNPGFVTAMHEALDSIEEVEGALRSSHSPVRDSSPWCLRPWF